LKCPNCGYEQPYTTTDEGRRFREAVFNRLTEYGHSDRMSPPKHLAYESVRKVIGVRFGLVFKAGGSMTKEMADKAIAALDEVLPRKEALKNEQSKKTT
jgi:hypothetical protein